MEVHDGKKRENLQEIKSGTYWEFFFLIDVGHGANNTALSHCNSDQITCSQDRKNQVKNNSVGLFSTITAIFLRTSFSVGEISHSADNRNILYSSFNK